MRAFPASMSRWRVGWLMVHGYVMLALGALLSWRCFSIAFEESSLEWRARNIGGAIAWAVAAVAGGTVIACGFVHRAARRREPWPAAKAITMRLFTGAVVMEFVLVFVAGGMILDCGMTASAIGVAGFVCNTVWLVLGRP